MVVDFVLGMLLVWLGFFQFGVVGVGELQGEGVFVQQGIVGQVDGFDLVGSYQGFQGVVQGVVVYVYVLCQYDVGDWFFVVNVV